MNEKNISKLLKEVEKIDMIKLVITALEKQIPYKPKPYPGYAGECKCGEKFLYKSTYYCGNCGQRLDFGE